MKARGSNQPPMNCKESAWKRSTTWCAPQRIADVGIPVQFEELVAASWREREPSLYGRFDLAFTGDTPKLLEYNADTPTSLLEAAVVQWYWLKDTHPKDDQFNSLHERLIDRWREISPAGEFIHFACDTDSYEDVGNYSLPHGHRMSGRLHGTLDLDEGHRRSKPAHLRLSTERFALKLVGRQ